jgi:RNA 2',3'-cyclic 3'-phosphodiesterase
MRAFIAVRVPELTGAIRWPRPPERHLTLRFLGEVSESRASEIRGAVERSVTGLAPFLLELRSGGCFPDRERPRVLWVGISRGATELLELAGRLGRELERIGFPPEGRAFVPHVTVLRIRNAREAVAARELLRQIERVPLGETLVNSVVLFESRLTREGARHRPVAEVPMGGSGSPSGPPPAPTA